MIARYLATCGWLVSQVQQRVSTPFTDGTAIVARGAVDFAGRLFDIPAELRERVTVQTLLDDAEATAERARQTYLALAGRGQDTVTLMRARPRVGLVLHGLADATTRFDHHVQNAADEIHDTSEELLGWATMSAYAAGGWLARPTPRRAHTALQVISHRPTP